MFDTDPPQIGNRSFYAVNIKLTRQILSLIIKKISDAAIDVAGNAEIVKELWSQLFAWYYKKEYDTELILYEKLIQLCHSKYKSSSNNIKKIDGLSQHLSNMGRV